MEVIVEERVPVDAGWAGVKGQPSGKRGRERLMPTLCPAQVCHVAAMCRCLSLLETCCQNFLETLQPFEGEGEHEIYNYLYNRSKEIEPKNCKKPPIKERKWPDIPLKSPGIKPRTRTVPNPLPSMFDQSFKFVKGAEGDDTPHMLTPPTPSTPCTPPHTANDNSIFAPVEIGTGTVVGGNDYKGSGIVTGPVYGSTSMSNIHPPQPSAPASNPHPLPSTSPQAPPPPLPPRVRKRESSIGDTSPKVKQAPGAPELPPRDVSPPPIPPRTGTLPRMQSSGGLQHGPTHHHHHAPLGHSLHSSSSNLHPHLSHHIHTHHHRNPPSLLVHPPPPPQQYPLDHPPHRRNNSVDLSSPTPMARRHTNGPQTVAPVVSNTNDSPANSSDHPPTPPPRLANRNTFSFSYDQQH